MSDLQTLSPAYSKCAPQGDDKSCSWTVPGYKGLAYTTGNQSAPSAIRYATVPSGTPCTDDTFQGDPAKNKRKTCWVTDIPDDLQPFWTSGSPLEPTELAAPFTKCVDEGSACNIPGSGKVSEIIYGTPGHYVYAKGGPKFNCSNDVFADPDPGATKTCYYRIPTVAKPAEIKPLGSVPTVPSVPSVPSVSSILSAPEVKKLDTKPVTKPVTKPETKLDTKPIVKKPTDTKTADSKSTDIKTPDSTTTSTEPTFFNKTSPIPGLPMWAFILIIVVIGIMVIGLLIYFVTKKKYNSSQGGGFLEDDDHWGSLTRTLME